MALSFLFFFVNLDNAPTAIVGLVGRKEYEQCAKDLYFFIQVILIL
jgi:sorting nexin-13